MNRFLLCVGLSASALCAGCGDSDPSDSAAKIGASVMGDGDMAPGFGCAAPFETIELGDALTVDLLYMGDGRVARRGDEVLLRYEGRTEYSDTPFVTTTGLYSPTRFVLDPKSDRRPIEGLALALEGLKQGTKARIHVPAHLAYGRAGLPESGIDAYADLIFEVELVEVRR